jgi:hypothetical protein
MLGFKSFHEADLNSMPIIVCGCGQSSTAETLDGHVGMGEVSDMDLYGEFVELRDIPVALPQSVPCPNCGTCHRTLQSSYEPHFLRWDARARPHER